MTEVPAHLGGQNGRCWDDEGCLDWAIETFDVQSMLDIGCGYGCQVKLARSKGLKSIGLEGDVTVFREDLQEEIDFTKTKYVSEIKYDLIWSVEFLEHVEEKYIDNYIEAFKSGSYVICTHAQPGQAGHHHVNCKPKSYWIDLFAKHGLFYSEEFTNQMKEASTMGKPFIKRNGLFFKQWPS
tara:strand:- start:62 stop:607 length:546 start_codon:yes stop_codon:yes gene_type:complete